MTCYKDLFSSLDTSINFVVKLGDRSQIQVSGKGIVPILTKNNVVKNIYNVYYVPTLAGNLLSVGQLDSRGYDIRFHDTSCTIYGPNKAFIAKIKMTKNRLYPLEMRSGKLYALNISTTNDIDLWHLRYGHLPLSSMNLLQKQSMVKGLSTSFEQLSSCTSRVLGKHKRDSFSTASHRAKE